MKTEKVDFLIVYEIKNRELENLCLLKCELERRGYTVGLYNTWNANKDDCQYFDANVVIGPWGCDDSRVYYLLTCSPNAEKIVNLQWEQILTNHDETITDNIYALKGVAREVVHISWGAKTYDRLVKTCGIAENKVKIAGNVTLDFLREEFKSYYLTREELFKKFEIPVGKKVILFISSFAYATLSEQLLCEMEKALKIDLHEFIELSVESQAQIIEWFKNILNTSDEYVIVYRPHPAELDDATLLNMEKEYDNFYVIGNLSVKQWIITCDNIYTWFSTSLAEIFAANKGCNILRPLEIPFRFDLSICKDAKFLSSFEQFKESLVKVDRSFPLNEELLRSYCEIDDKIPAYKKLCDILEDVFNNQEYSLKATKAINRLPGKLRLKLLLRNTFLYVFLKRAIKTIKSAAKIIKNTDEQSAEYILQIKNKNYSCNSEIEEIMSKLKKIVLKHAND